ncbi:heme exporter protein CcmD [Endozoicomonas sp. SCSIO W0465]|uniref:heme exporter protein CcmD n=1 Tax=Endozoicomonas sp. SCSIO W0465 TaxID=2918516 RepID=UPI0020751594|nr:heme exporter protein CcmD [Endozoicomonas sp. SCSIO W0465]USE38610.1 heme exporter protein CcmD [Endozoicomonas sp. SCSIO W0465]
MYFDSWSGFLVMDGHGLFVWSAYAIAVVVIAYNLIAPFVARRQILAQIAAQVRRQERVVERKKVVNDFKVIADSGADAEQCFTSSGRTQPKHCAEQQEEGPESVRSGERSAQ